MVPDGGTVALQAPGSVCVIVRTTVAGSSTKKNEPSC